MIKDQVHNYLHRSGVKFVGEQAADTMDDRAIREAGRTRTKTAAIVGLGAVTAAATAGILMAKTGVAQEGYDFIKRAWDQNQSQDQNRPGQPFDGSMSNPDMQNGGLPLQNSEQLGAADITLPSHVTAEVVRTTEVK